MLLRRFSKKNLVKRDTNVELFHFKLHLSIYIKFNEASTHLDLGLVGSVGRVASTALNVIETAGILRRHRKQAGKESANQIVIN